MFDARLSLDSKSDFGTRNTFVEQKSEIARLDGLHNTDSARLTQVEIDLKTIAVDTKTFSNK